MSKVSKVSRARGVRCAALAATVALVLAAPGGRAPADDDIPEPLPAGTRVDLSVASVGPIHHVVVADRTYVAVEDQGLWVLQPDGTTIEKAGGPVDMIVALGTDGHRYYLGGDAGLFAGRAGDLQRVVPDMISALCIQRDPPLYLAGTHHGMWRSADGAEWSPAAFPDLLVVSCAIAGTRAYAGTSDGVFRSHDRGQTWAAASGEFRTRYTAALAVDGETVYAATAGGGLYISTDAAASWTRSGTAPLLLSDVAVENGVIAVLSDDTLQRSTDGGATWTSSPRGRLVRLKTAAFLDAVGAVQ